MVTKEQVIDILEKFDFFQGQRAGRELWNDKPFDVQEKDINNFSRDVSLIKEYISDVAQKSEWISVDDRLPTEDEYLTHHNDGLDTLKRLLIAYQTDTIEYQIGCYDGWKWMNQLGNRVVKGVVAWKPFEAYELPKMKGGAE